MGAHLSIEPGALALVVQAPDGSAIHEVRDERVMLDADLAALFGVPTRVFNQAFKRNRERFPAGWAFELTADELDDLRSQIVISSLAGANWGGRRYLPWAFTEHGVVLAASLLNSDRAKAVMQLVVEVFVQARRGQLGGNALAKSASQPVIAASRPGINHRLQSMIERLMESLISQDDQRSLREEAQAVFRVDRPHPGEARPRGLRERRDRGARHQAARRGRSDEGHRRQDTGGGRRHRCPHARAQADDGARGRPCDRARRDGRFLESAEGTRQVLTDQTLSSYVQRNHARRRCHRAGDPLRCGLPDRMEHAGGHRRGHEFMMPVPGALGHIKVLDITTFLSGPYATQVLGDLGADVIKIEQITGDDTRRLPPNFIAGDSAYFHSINRNKKSVAVNLRDKAGQDLVRRLAANCDVLIENMRPGGLAKYGLGYEALSALYPRLIYASLSGFGQTGPYRDHPAYDMVVQALSGGMSLTGEPDGRPVRSGIPLGDLSAGLYTVIGITSALEARHRTGKGQFIDVSMLDCQVAMLCYQAAYYLASGKVPGPQGRAHESIPTYRSFTAGDGLDFVICANTDRMWRSLCDCIGRVDLRDDERLATREGRYNHRTEIWAALEAAFQAKTADEWVIALREHEVPVGVVNTLDRSLTDAQVLHRDMVLDIPGAGGAHVKVAGNPLKMSGDPRGEHRFPPRLGQDTRDVLAAELGLSGAEMDALAKAGVVKAS